MGATTHLRDANNIRALIMIASLFDGGMMIRTSFWSIWTIFKGKITLSLP